MGKAQRNKRSKGSGTESGKGSLPPVEKARGSGQDVVAAAEFLTMLKEAARIW